MFKWLRRLVRRREERPSYVDARIGTLIWNPDLKSWETQVPLEGRTITVTIGGAHEPDRLLLKHARQILGNWRAFEQRIDAFLGREAGEKQWATAAAEIQSLRVEIVDLPWPYRPDDGMIWFSGPSEDRRWRCDYVGGEPQGLGFDT